MHISFIGTGIMGSRMAANLLAGGHMLTVHNRTREKTATLSERGAQWAATPASAAQGADLVITMLAHPQAVEIAALDRESGFLNALKQGAVWIDCSTVNPAFARRMAEEAHMREVRFIEAPVAGSKNQAQDAQLVFFAGGDTALVDEYREVFAAMGKQVSYVGEVGMGNAIKLVVNHMLATSMLAFAEGLVLGESLGLSREMMLNTLIGGPVTAPYIAGKRQKIESETFEAEFPLRWMQKDLQMVAESAYQSGAAMPLANAAKETFQLAVRAGYGDSDLSAIYAFLKGKG